MRSTRVPIGIANSSHGSIVSAAIIEIKTGSLVRVEARSGAAVPSKPSEKLLARAADQRLLKVLPSDLVLVVGTFAPSQLS